MRSGVHDKKVGLFLLFAVLLMGADGGGLEGDERDTLRKQDQALQARIEMLRREQDGLLFQKAMCAVDSKYLILNFRENSGQLKFKNRVLTDFRFIRSKNISGDELKTGALVLTKKTEGKGNRAALIFGKSLIIQGKRAAAPPPEADVPFISLTNKEMLSIFSSVEEGALAYIMP
jgi:hypothetical protein